MNEQERRETASLFGLSDGQFFAFHRHKNLVWKLNGETFGFGDLTDENIRDIQLALKENQVFEGFHEWDGTIFQQRTTPLIRITRGSIWSNKEIVEKEGT